jgi:hypothetical protein
MPSSREALAVRDKCRGIMFWAGLAQEREPSPDSSQDSTTHGRRSIVLVPEFNQSPQVVAFGERELTRK